jgi:hypothetical protein
VPVPVPASVTVRANCELLLNVAVTDSAAVISIVQVPVPPQPDCPLQPANVEPEPAVAVSVTEVPPVKLAEQPLPQLMPCGELTTVPLPVPAFSTVRVKFEAVNVAVTDSAAVMSIVQVPVPPQPDWPVHPANVEPEPAVAVNVTVVPLA